MYKPTKTDCGAIFMTNYSLLTDSSWHEGPIKTDYKYVIKEKVCQLHVQDTKV